MLINHKIKEKLGKSIYNTVIAVNISFIVEFYLLKDSKISEFTSKAVINHLLMLSKNLDKYPRRS